MLRPFALACLLAGLASAETFTFAPEQSQHLKIDGKSYLETMISPHDPANREATYKVYTHIYSADGATRITKGPGGKYTHHRGIFIGWKDTIVNGTDYDTWHMDNCYQHHVAWKSLEQSDKSATQVETIEWRALEGDKPFIEETRTITANAEADGLRVIDFTSDLVSKAGTIELKGDLQHAGMQIRMAQEVAEHEDTTQYILPEGATEDKDDQVLGGSWACANVEISGKRYWVLHMTPKKTFETPVYSVRQYARFGSFFEPTLEEGKPLSLTFRIIVSEKELDRAACEKLYTAYNGS